MKKHANKENPLKKQVKIHYNEDRETDTFDFYEDEEPYKEIQVT